MSSSQFPISTNKKCFLIDGKRVEIIYNIFNDNNSMLIITMIDKLGSIVSITQSDYKIMIGKRDDIRIDAISKHIQSIMPENRKLILSIGLPKEEEHSLIKKLIKLISIIIQ